MPAFARGASAGLAFLALAGVAAPAAAQQGSVQVTGAAQAVTGDPERLAGQSRLEPDFAINWFQPRETGSMLMELRATRRGSEPHLGRAYFAWRDARFRGATWTLEGGDFFFSPAVADYRFTNLSTPAITLAGGAVSARTDRSSAGFVAGRTTAWRNIFGSDPDTLKQNVALLRATHKPLDWLDLNARASVVRTTDVKEFVFTVADSDQAGAGMRVAIGPSFHVVADGAYVHYRRIGSTERLHDYSATAGASFLHSRGWLQGNVARFSPGDFPVVNYPLADRESAFLAGELDVWRFLRVFAGGEAFRGNLDPEGAAQTPVRVPETEGMRGFGGVRVNFFGRTSVAVRVEDGDRRTRRTRQGAFVSSDTGVVTAELQTRIGSVTSFFRASQRENVESIAGNGYKQTDGTVQLFFNLSGDIQLFGTGIATRNVLETGAGTTYYQLGGGGQFQLFNRTIWLRLEGIAARNQDMVSDLLVARESYNIGINGTIARNTTLGFNMFAERSPALSDETSPWLGRTTLRVTRNFPTGAVRLPGSTALGASEPRARGTGSVVGSVYADWDADGVPDPDEGPLEGIPILLGKSAAATTSARGDFTFTNVPAGSQRVQVDLGALPVDFDPPTVPGLEIDLSRGETRRVAFGLVPLGTVAGRVLRDANGNNIVDDADEPVDAAVLVLDGGQRSEQARKGQYRFEAIRSGKHTLELLLDSLPEGATMIGERSVEASVTRERLHNTIDFLVRIEKRPEIRKTFPPRGGTGGGAGSAKPPAGAKPAPASTPRPGTAKPPATRAPQTGTAKPPVAPPRTASAQPRPVASLPASPGGFTIQVAALSTLEDARALAAELQRAGYQSYVVNPPPEGAGGLYRVRVGRYTSRAAAVRTVARLEEMRGEKLWVTREQ